MLGAIAGDIIGSVFEFHNIKTVDFQLYSKRSRFTDDTVLTVALADSILSGIPYLEKIKEYYNLYPDSGYGGRFRKWAASDDTEPYNSFGNGSAMRVSAVGWVYNSLDAVLIEAERSAMVTHNHPEGIKGAQSVAAAIYLARTGSPKKEIKEYIEKTFSYNLSDKLDDIRPHYRFDETCQGSVPQSIIAFLESEDYEDAVREAISIGGDSDTLEKLYGKGKNINKLISSIFITPDDEALNEQFQKFNEDKILDIPKVHIHWNDEDENVETITSFLKTILYDEVKGDIEAINEYTKHTIKSFITFVENDFKSAIEEELEGETIRDIYYDFDMFKIKYINESNFHKYSCDLISDFDEKLKSENYKNILIRYSITHPVSVFIKTDNKNKFGKKIFCLTRNSKNIMIRLVLSNHDISNEDKKILADYFSAKFNVVDTKSFGFEIKPREGEQFNIDNILELFDKQYKMIIK